MRVHKYCAISSTTNKSQQNEKASYYRAFSLCGRIIFR